MDVIRTRTFKSGNSEAVRLPKEISFGPNTELILVRSGDVITIYPAGASLSDMASKLLSMPKPDRIEPRDSEELPEREGL